MSDTETNISYWKKYIMYKFGWNLNLFAEFELKRSGTTTLYDEPVRFNDDYVLKELKKIELLGIIKEVIKTNFPDRKYYVSTRAKYDSTNIYIVVSLIQP
jgi:hypothetical protein